MNHPVIPIALEGATKQRKRQAPKGRVVGSDALEQVRALIGDRPVRQRLLIEFLHLIQDEYGQLGSQHIAALAKVMGLAQTEVYEVASYHHHFDIVRENKDGTFDSPAALTVRVCDGLSCEMAGAGELLAKLPGILGKEVRACCAPCRRPLRTGPEPVVHQNPVPNATVEKVQALVKADAIEHKPDAYITMEQYIAKGDYSLLKELLSGKRDASVIKVLRRTPGLRGLGGAG